MRYINFASCRSLCLLLTVGLLGACASSTQVTNTWKSPDIEPSDYQRVFVAVLSGDVSTRELIENEMAARLQQQGIEVVKSLDVFTPEFTEEQLKGSEEDKEKILERVQEGGSNAILTIAVVDEEDETRYVPGNVTYDPTVRFNFYGNFWGYYSHYAPLNTNQGYYTEDKIYFLETNLYDTKTEKLVWSSQSRSYNPEDTEAFSGEFAQLTVEEMQKEEVI